jgi:hypothetical protein
MHGVGYADLYVDIPRWIRTRPLLMWESIGEFEHCLSVSLEIDKLCLESLPDTVFVLIGNLCTRNSEQTWDVFAIGVHVHTLWPLQIIIIIFWMIHPACSLPSKWVIIRPRASCAYIHNFKVSTAMLREETALRLAMPLWCYYQKTQNGFCLSYYMTSCTLLEEPTETTINGASSGAKWRTQYHAPTISVQVGFLFNTEISSRFF